MSELSLRTVNDVLALMAERGESPAILAQDGEGVWQPISCAEVYGRARALAGALERLGVEKGDRVAILSENRWEWAVADFAILALGAVCVPLYATSTPAQVGYMLRNSEAKVAFVSGREQRAKLRAADAGELADLKHVVVMNAWEVRSDESFSTLIEGAERERDPAFDAKLKETDPDDLCTIIYTSGTTGDPKGVELTHGNLASNINPSFARLDLKEGDRHLEFLPLSHVYARHVDYGVYASGLAVAHVARTEDLAAAMKAIKPTMFVGVPRVYEKIRQGVEANSSASVMKKWILSWAIGVGRAHRQEVLKGLEPGSLTWSLADSLVYSKIREAFGGCVTTFISGSAALGMDTAGWFADVGIRIFEGYGLTETSPVIAVNFEGAHRMGTIGRALPNMEVRLAEDGEVEVRGPSVFKRYWKKENATAEAFTEDGWFKTGDIGSSDVDGYWSITDRKKEILKTSGGKMIAPQPIEGRLKANVLVGNAAVVGDKHKYVSVLISPNAQALKRWAKANAVRGETLAELVRDERVKMEYRRIVTEVNKGLAPWETLKRIKLLAEEWTIEGGELTSTMKLKRRVIAEKYAAEIKLLYKDEAASRES